MKNKIILFSILIILASVVYAATTCIPHPCSSDEDCIGVIEITKGKSWKPGCKNPGEPDSCCKETFCGIWCTLENEISKCNDDDPTTSDRCINPDTCDAKCIHTSCQPECEEDTDCNDDDPTTGDFCKYSGTCQARCFHDKCEVECSTNADCEGKQVCFLAGLCNAYCGELICDTPPECYEDSDCDDDNEITTDKCEAASSCEAHCTHVACPIACNTDEDCDDEKANTADTCENPGKCDAECKHKDLGYLEVTIETVPKTEYKTSETMTIDILLADSEGETITEGKIILFTPQEKEPLFREIGNGKYSIAYKIPENMPLGTHEFQIRATKTIGTNAVRGIEKFNAKIVPGTATTQEKDVNTSEDLPQVTTDTNVQQPLELDENFMGVAGLSLMFAGALVLVVLVGIIISGVILLIYLKGKGN